MKLYIIQRYEDWWIDKDLEGGWRNYCSICAEWLSKTMNRSRAIPLHIPLGACRVWMSKFVTVLSRALRCIFWARLIHSTWSYHFCKGFVLTFRLCLSQPSDLFPTDFPDKNSVCISPPHPCALHAAPILISFIWSLWTVQIMRLLITQTSYQLLTSNYVAVQKMSELDHGKYRSANPPSPEKMITVEVSLRAWFRNVCRLDLSVTFLVARCSCWNATLRRDKAWISI